MWFWPVLFVHTQLSIMCWGSFVGAFCSSQPLGWICLSKQARRTGSLGFLDELPFINDFARALYCLDSWLQVCMKPVHARMAGTSCISSSRT